MYWLHFYFIWLLFHVYSLYDIIINNLMKWSRTYSQSSFHCSTRSSGPVGS